MLIYVLLDLRSLLEATFDTFSYICIILLLKHAQHAHDTTNAIYKFFWSFNSYVLSANKNTCDTAYVGK